MSRDDLLKVLSEEIELLKSWIEDLQEDKCSTYLINPMEKRLEFLVSLYYKELYPNIETFDK